MIAAARGEAGVLVYERFINADGALVCIYERYVGATAAVAHVHAFQRQFGQRLASLVERKRFIVFGTPSAELTEILNGFGAT